MWVWMGGGGGVQRGGGTTAWGIFKRMVVKLAHECWSAYSRCLRPGGRWTHSTDMLLERVLIWVPSTVHCGNAPLSEQNLHPSKYGRERWPLRQVPSQSWVPWFCGEKLVKMGSSRCLLRNLAIAEVSDPVVAWFQPVEDGVWD